MPLTEDQIYKRKFYEDYRKSRNAQLPSDFFSMKFGLDLPPQQRVYAGFFVYSFCMGSLPPRLPDLQRMMQIKEGPLGFGLIGVAAGTLVSLGLSGPILERIGYRRSILTLIPLLALLYAIASFAGGPLAFFLLLFPVGIVDRRHRDHFEP